MQVGAVGGGSPTASAHQAGGSKDQVLESIRKQIEDTRKQLKEVSKDDSLSPEVKRQRQKELNEQLADLQKQLTERQNQIRQEEKEAVQKSKEGAQNAQEPQGAQAAGDAGNTDNALNEQQMRALISMDSALENSRKMDSVRISQKGRAHVLAREIETDSSRAGGVTPSKLEEYAKTESAVQNATGELFESISEISSAASQSAQAAGRTAPDETAKSAEDKSPAEEAADRSGDGQEQKHIDTYA